MKRSLCYDSLTLATAPRYHRTDVFESPDMYDYLKVGDRCPDNIFADEPNSLPILKDKKTGNICMIDDKASSTCFLDSEDFLNKFNYPIDNSLDASQDNKIQSEKDHFTDHVSYTHEELDICAVEEVTSTTESSTDQYSSEQYSTEQNSSEESSNEQFSNEQQCRAKREKKVDSLSRFCSDQRKKTDTLPQRHKHNAEEYKCPKCPYSSIVYEALINHQAAHASGNTNVTLLISCKICGEDHSSRMGIEMHMKTHKINGSFFCDVCSWSSPQLKKVIQHRRIHTSEKPHLCPHCNYRTSRRDNLRSHIRRVHNKLNVYIDTFNPN